MALRTEDGEPISSQSEWLEFFISKMKFPPKSSADYAKYLFDEGFTGEILEECIQDPDMRDNIGMRMGEYKKLAGHIRQFHQTTTPSNHTPSTSHTPHERISNIPRPMIKMDSTQLEYDQFAFEWNRYKLHYRLSADQIATNLFFCCSEDVRQHIRTRQDCLGSTDNWAEHELLELIKDIATSKVSPIVHVQQFLNIKQNTNEKCQDYLRRLQVKASCCNFSCTSCRASNVNERVKEKFIIGLRNHVIQTHLIKTESINPGTPLDRILTEAVTLEQSMQDQAAISKEPPATFAAEQSDSDSTDDVLALNKSYRSNTRRNERFAKACSGCGSKDHKDSERSSKCRAWKLKCNFCGNMGHMEKVCRQARSKKPSANNRHVKSAEMSLMVIGEVSSLNLPIKVKPVSSAQYVAMSAFPDTGANICLLGPQQLAQLDLKSSKINRCKNHISVAGGTTILATGWFEASFNLNDSHSKQTVYFSNKADRLFLSRQTCIDLGVVPPSFPFPPSECPQTKSVASVEAASKTSSTLPPKTPSTARKENTSRLRAIPSRPLKIPFTACEKNIPKLLKFLLMSFADSAFSRKGPFPKLSTPQAHIHLKPHYVTPKPAYWPARVAEHWAEEVKRGLDEDVEAGILIKVPFNEPTEWCARMVIVSKRDGRPRRTVDYQQLNAQCLREPNHGESPFHTAHRIPSNTWKSVFDAVNGYHAVELDEESSKLTTFITPWGRYRYLRFPQGHCSAGDAFNGRVQQILSKIPRLVRVVDDMCLFDDTIEGAFWHAWDLLETCVKNGIVLNESKFQFCSKSIKFAGLSVTADAVQPSPDLMAAIRDFPPPTDITKARSFFGLVNQVQWAYSNCAEMAPFRDLVKPNSTFMWDKTLESLFEKSKSKILEQVRRGVKNYDTCRATCLQTDFSKAGLGYLLLQKYCSCPLQHAPLCCHEGWQLVFAGSRFTKGAEERYAPTEGELLAVAWALDHARIFTQGCRNLIISTDHKPLLGILNDKPLERIKNPRIVRLKEQLVSYTFTMKYNKGKWHHAPDALSRSPHQSFFLEMLQPFVSEPVSEELADGHYAILALSELSENTSVSMLKMFRVPLQMTLQ